MAAIMQTSYLGLYALAFGLNIANIKLVYPIFILIMYELGHFLIITYS